MCPLIISKRATGDFQYVSTGGLSSFINESVSVLSNDL